MTRKEVVALRMWIDARVDYALRLKFGGAPSIGAARDAIHADEIAISALCGVEPGTATRSSYEAAGTPEPKRPVTDDEIERAWLRVNGIDPNRIGPRQTYTLNEPTRDTVLAAIEGVLRERGPL